MRVLLFSNHFADESQHGPMAELVRARAGALAALGADVRVVVASAAAGATAPREAVPPATDGSRRADGPAGVGGVFRIHPDRERFSFWRIGSGARPLRPALRCLHRIRAEFDFDVIEAHGVLPAGLFAARLARQLGVPCVVYALGPELEQPRRRAALRPPVAAALASAEQLLAPSAVSAEMLFRLGGDRHKIHVVPDGIDPVTLRFEDPHDARQALGLAPDEVLLIATCEPGDAPCHRLLAETVARLRSGGVRARLHAMGGRRRRLHSQATTPGGVEAVVGPADIDPDQRSLWYQAASLQIAACSGEFWPHPALQAQAYGLPLVATAAEGVDEIVSDATGIIVAERSSSALAEGIRNALARTWDRPLVADHAPRHRWPEVTARRLRILRAAALARQPHTPTLQLQPA